MTKGEFFALLDDRLSDGKRYPTLDEYSRALDAIALATKRQMLADMEARHQPVLVVAPVGDAWIVVADDEGKP